MKRLKRVSSFYCTNCDWTIRCATCKKKLCKPYNHVSQLIMSKVWNGTSWKWDGSIPDKKNTFISFLFHRMYPDGSHVQCICKSHYVKDTGRYCEDCFRPAIPKYKRIKPYMLEERKYAWW